MRAANIQGPVLDAAGHRSHVDRRINDREAVIVRRIFELCAQGHGTRSIAKLLNAAGGHDPRGTRTGAGGCHRVRSRLAHWRSLLMEESVQARQMLRRLLRGRLVFTPDLENQACDYVGEGDLSEVFRGLVTVPKALASPIRASWNQLRGWLQHVEGLRRAA